MLNILIFIIPLIIIFSILGVIKLENKLNIGFSQKTKNIYTNIFISEIIILSIVLLMIV